MTPTRPIRSHNQASSPWWRAFPCLLALAALLWGPEDGRPPKSSGEQQVRNVHAVAYQQTDSDADNDPSPEVVTDPIDLSSKSIEQHLRHSMSKEQVSAADLAAANQVVAAITPADWMGPLAPIALSPFFGITCLSGLSIWGPDWMPANGLLNSASPLKNQSLFWTFVVLTIVTSVPRFSKVSKPIGQAIDQVEAYAGIITLFVIRFLVVPAEPTAETSDVVAAGFVSATWSGFLYAAMVINVLVINAVKFFFEFLIWLTPVPFLDACFEVANKSLCMGLMALYAFSPTLATLMNLVMFLLCLLVLKWISRRVSFYRTMMLDTLLSMVSTGYAKPSRGELVVFPHTDWAGFQDKSRLTLVRDEQGIKIRQSRWLRKPLEIDLPAESRIVLRKGWLTNELEIDGDEPIVMTFSRRHHQHFEELARRLGAEIEATSAEVDPKVRETEFA